MLSEWLRILMLMCHPELYQAMAGAELFDLESSGHDQQEG